MTDLKYCGFDHVAFVKQHYGVADYAIHVQKFARSQPVLVPEDHDGAVCIPDQDGVPRYWMGHSAKPYVRAKFIKCPDGVTRHVPCCWQRRATMPEIILATLATSFEFEDGDVDGLTTALVGIVNEQTAALNERIAELEAELDSKGKVKRTKAKTPRDLNGRILATLADSLHFEDGEMDGLTTALVSIVNEQTAALNERIAELEAELDLIGLAF